MRFLGDYATSSTINLFFTTSGSDGQAIAPSSALEIADIILYKGVSATQRTSASGMTMTSPFDGIVGLHAISIDTSDNTDAGFFAAGNDYTIVLDPDETIDSQFVISVLGQFSLQNRLTSNILTDTTEIGTAGAGLTDLGGMATAMKAEVNAECDTALSDYGANTTTPPTVQAIADQVWVEQTSGHTGLGTFGRALSEILTLITSSDDKMGAFTKSNGNTVLGFFKAALSKTSPTPSGIGGNYDAATDSLEALQDNTHTLSVIADAVWDETTGAHEEAFTFGEMAVFLSQVRQMIGSPTDLTGNGTNTLLGYIRASLESGGTLPSLWSTSYDPTTDSQQAIKDRGDAAWITGAGSGGSGFEV